MNDPVDKLIMIKTKGMAYTSKVLKLKYLKLII